MPLNALVHARASKPLKPGALLQSRGGSIRVIEKRGDLWVVELPDPALSFFEQYGQMPLPPYIRREPDLSDVTRYQSVFARRQGAVAAPTASLHFDAGLLADLRGARRASRLRHAARGRRHFSAGAHRRGGCACHARRIRRGRPRGLRRDCRRARCAARA